MNAVFIAICDLQTMSGQRIHIEKCVKYLSHSSLINWLFIFDFLPNANTKRGSKLILFIVSVYLMARNRYDVYYIRYGLWTLPLILFPVQIVYEINGQPSNETKNYFMQRLHRIAEALLWCAAKVRYRSVSFILVTDSLTKLIPIENVRYKVINNGTDLQRGFQKSISVEPKIYFIGNLTGWQNIEGFLYIAEELRLIDRLCFIGTGGSYERLRSKYPNVFIGNLEQESIPENIESGGFGLILDSRFDQHGQPLFSPMKMYEYISLGLEPLIFNVEGHWGLRHFNSATSLKEILSTDSRQDFQTRTWEQVYSEVEEFIIANT